MVPLDFFSSSFKMLQMEPNTAKKNLKIVSDSSRTAHSNEYHIARDFPPFYFIFKWDVLLRLQHVADLNGNGNVGNRATV